MKIKFLIVTIFFLLFQTINVEAKSSKKIRFIAVGDTGTGERGQYKVARQIEKKCKKDGCDFALILGDNIYSKGVKSPYDKQFQTKFEEPYKNLDFKFYMTLGNHDYDGNVQAQIDYTRISKKWYMPDRTYNFMKGNIEFFSIDTNRPSKAQAERISKAISKSKAKWKIVFGHHPRYSNGVYKDATGELKEMLDKILCDKATLYLSGHEHNKQHLAKVCGVEYLVLGSGSSKRRKVEIASNTLFAEASLGFAYFEVSDSKIKFQIIDKKGNVDYEYRIRK